MAAEKMRIAFGSRVFGLGLMVLGVIGLVTRDFLQGQPVPKGFPARTALALACGALILAAGAALEWRPIAVWGAAALTAYYGMVVLALMYGRVLLKDYAIYGTYEGLAEQLGITAAALILYTTFAHIDGQIGAPLAAGLARLGQISFGVCALIFGGAHFVYMNLTAPLVPKWLPPSQVFWGYATAVCFFAAGIALLTGIKARLAAILLTVMLATFALLIHTPMLLADRHNRGNWIESAMNFVLLGAAWVVADSLPRPRAKSSSAY
jgi:uncharacterized membrane protein